MTKRTPGCYTPVNTSIKSVSGNCQCEPCCEPVLISCNDIGETECTPILTEVIQNCTVDYKQDSAYPDNIVFHTRNLPRSSNTNLNGTICIRSIELFYNCIGLVPTPASGTTTPVWVNSIQQNFTINQACTATSSSGVTTSLFNEAYGTIRTSQCCCNGRPQDYSQVKVVDKRLDFAVSDLNIVIRGRIGNCEFIADSIGLLTPDNGTSGIDTFAANNPLFLSDLGSSIFNFAEKLCLPTNEQVKLSEVYDTSLSVDCVQPVDSTYVSENDTIGLFGTEAQQAEYPNVSFVASAEIGLFVKKSLFASIKKALAVLSTDAKINCQKQSPKVPDRPANICTGNDPCPKCMQVPTSGVGPIPGCLEVSQCGSSNVICPPIP